MIALDALRAAILADPTDDLPRLAYADWLEEHGDEEAQVRARFIRVQLRLANCGQYCPYDKLKWPCECEFCTLTREEGYILGSLVQGEITDRFTAWTADLRRILGMRVSEATPDLAVPSTGYAAVRFRRGFVADLVCHPEQWFNYHAELMDLYPLERVAIFDQCLRADPLRLFTEARWITPPGDGLHVKLSSGKICGEVVVPLSEIHQYGFHDCIEKAELELCHQVWPGIQLIYAREGR